MSNKIFLFLKNRHILHFFADLLKKLMQNVKMIIYLIIQQKNEKSKKILPSSISCDKIITKRLRGRKHERNNGQTKQM